MNYRKSLINLVKISNEKDISLKELIEDFIIKESIKDDDLDDLLEEIENNEVLKQKMIQDHLNNGYPNIYGIKLRELLF
jgi:hypothetical protein